jgi:hypothetical protein
MVALRLADGTPTGDELFGLWRDDPAAVAFGGQDVQVWRADLPADTALAHNRLVACGAWLQHVDAQLSEAAAQLEAPEPSADLAFTVGGNWRDACGTLAGLADQVARACTPTSLIETTVGGELVGRSLVGLRGDVRTAWRAGRGKEEALLHQATVELALSTRATVLQMVAVVAHGACAIAVRLALPGGPLLALPVAWGSIQRLLSEVTDALDERGTRW